MCILLLFLTSGVHFGLLNIGSEMYYYFSILYFTNGTPCSATISPRFHLNICVSKKNAAFVVENTLKYYFRGLKKWHTIPNTHVGLREFITFHTNHSVEICGFFCHSDFT